MGLGTKILSGLNGSYGTYLEGWGGGVIKAPYPYSERIPAGMSEDQYTEYCLLDNHIPSCIAGRDNIAGILVEPGLAEGGNWVPSTRFLTGIRDICDKNDWLMISDEVLTGLGRTGRMWGIEHYDVVALRHCAESPRATTSWATTANSRPAPHSPERRRAVRQRFALSKSSNGSISWRMQNTSVISRQKSCANGKRTALCARHEVTACCSV
jgi:hypothetical protein